MRLAQETVKVNVVGDEAVATFSTVQAAGYILIHESDLKALVKSARESQ